MNSGLRVVLPQEEMYIFMEYCDEGTLEEVSRLGLQEHVNRLYSKQITIAINVLHEHGIVHRDIKGNSGHRLVSHT
jgi:mitogen-activated protein kinase kinase kinase 4